MIDSPQQCESHANSLGSQQDASLAPRDPERPTHPINPNTTTNANTATGDRLGTTVVSILSTLERKWRYKRQGFELQYINILSQHNIQGLDVDVSRYGTVKVSMVKPSKNQGFLNTNAAGFSTWKEPVPQPYDFSLGVPWKWEDRSKTLPDVVQQIDFKSLVIDKLLMMKPGTDPIDGTPCQEPFYQIREGLYSRNPGTRYYFGMKTGRMLKVPGHVGTPFGVESGGNITEIA